MGTRFIIVLSPLLNLGLGVVERQEPVGIYALLSESAIEAFDLGVVLRLAGPAEVQLHRTFIRPFAHDLENELAAIVDLDRR